MVYCSAVNCKSNSSRRKEDIYIYFICFYGLPRDRDLTLLIPGLLGAPQYRGGGGLIRPPPPYITSPFLMLLP